MLWLQFLRNCWFICFRVFLLGHVFFPRTLCVSCNFLSLITNSLQNVKHSEKEGGVCSCFTHLTLLWEEFMEGRRRETSTIEAILIFHCASIMSKSKPICAQQLHVASPVTGDGDGPETAQWLSCCWWLCWLSLDSHFIIPCLCVPIRAQNKMRMVIFTSSQRLFKNCS